MAYEWVPSSTDSCVPPNALLTGHDIDGSAIYVGRASHEGHLMPAKVIRKQVAYIPFRNKEVTNHNFDFLCGSNFEWVASANGHVPENAVSSGTTSYGEVLYVGRAHINGSLTTGKIHPSQKCIYLPFNGKEYKQSEYEALVCSPPKCEWIPVTANSAVPPGAIQGGHDQDGSPIYVARAYHESDLIPGKYVVSHGVCYVAHGGSEHAKQQFDILCNGNVSWVPTSNGHVPPGALQAGHTDSGEPLYVGRSDFQGSITVGNVQPSNKALYIPFGGKEVELKEHDILVEL